MTHEVETEPLHLLVRHLHFDGRAKEFHEFVDGDGLLGEDP